LKRANRERLDPPQPGRPSGIGVKIITAKDTSELVGEKPPDASESPLLYLFFIIILIVEQAMAVHLSFHLKGNEAAPAAPQSAPAAAA
jgi:hypothetical protein